MRKEFLPIMGAKHILPPLGYVCQAILGMAQSPNKKGSRVSVKKWLP
jgi:hypothetical protein